MDGLSLDECPDAATMDVESSAGRERKAQVRRILPLQRLSFSAVHGLHGLKTSCLS
jgi:hypothetical protein